MDRKALRESAKLLYICAKTYTNDQASADRMRTQLQ